MSAQANMHHAPRLRAEVLVTKWHAPCWPHVLRPHCNRQWHSIERLTPGWRQYCIDLSFLGWVVHLRRGFVLCAKLLVPYHDLHNINKVIPWPVGCLVSCCWWCRSRQRRTTVSSCKAAEENFFTVNYASERVGGRWLFMATYVVRR